MVEDEHLGREQGYRDVLDLEAGARIIVRFKTRIRDVVDYAVILTIREADGREVPVRLYDGAHGINELHRYTRSGKKRLAEQFHSGTLGEGMRAAVAAVRDGYMEMIDGWRTT